MLFMMRDCVYRTFVLQGQYHTYFPTILSLLSLSPSSGLQLHTLCRLPIANISVHVLNSGSWWPLRYWLAAVSLLWRGLVLLRRTFMERWPRTTVRPARNGTGRKLTWRRHDMETLSALMVICEGNPLVTGRFSAQRVSNVIFDVFFDVNPKRLLNKQWSYRWFATPWRSCDVSVMAYENL